MNAASCNWWRDLLYIINRANGRATILNTEKEYQHYRQWINAPEQSDDLVVLRNAVNRGVPYGRESWVKKMVWTYHLESTVRTPGRPKKQ